MPRGRQLLPYPLRDWHCINYGAFRRCPKKRKWSLSWGEVGTRFVSHLCSLCCVPLPQGCVWLTAPQSSLRSVWPATSNSRLPSPTLFLPSHLHANSLFTAYALLPLAMNSGQRPHHWADYHLPTNWEKGKMQQEDNIGETLGKRSPEAQACIEQRSGF